MSSPPKDNDSDKADSPVPGASPATTPAPAPAPAPSGAPKSGSPPPSYDIAKASPGAKSAPAAPAVTPVVAAVDKDAVKELSAMFPIIDAGVIEAVLESTGSKDAAAEHLLGMTDPTFVPDAAPSDFERERQASLDADFARALHFQDRANREAFPPPPRAPSFNGRAAQAQARAADASRRVRDTLAARLDRDRDAQPFNPATYVPPYQPRVRRPRAPRHEPSPYDGEYARAQELQRKYGEDDVQFTDFERRVLDIAEQGKATFASLLGRARQQYDNFQDSHDRGQNPEASTSGGLWGAPRPSARWSPSDMDDVEDAQPLSPHAVSGKISPQRSGSASPGSPSGRPSSPVKIDLAKLGFLPKRRVELLSASGDNSVQSPTTPTHAVAEQKSQQSQHRHVPSVSPHQLGDSDDDDDDDDLGYTVNPFDKK